jgi:SpoVK/Ycf46/Vps4 family AAA+-type ATPase
VRSGVCAVHIATDDYSQLDEFAAGLAAALGCKAVEWNYGYGLVEFPGKVKIDEKAGLDEALRDQMYDKTLARNKLFLIKNARLVLEGEQNGKNLAQLQQTILRLKKYNAGRSLILYTDEKRLMPDALSSLVYFVEVPAPARDELASLAEARAARAGVEIPPAVRQELASTCVGMSKDSFLQILDKALGNKERFNNEVLAIAQKAKKQFVDKSGLLKFVETSEDMDGVGGLGHLKWWLDQESKAFFNRDAAREANIQSAKGIMLAGMPGCGKSLSAKAIAKKYNLPLLSLDLGSLMGKYLGESEENLRRALKIAENASPCVLWVDEIEKAFAGLSGDESGVTQRLFGYLLTWLNDKTAPIFVVATANDISVLPPEFLRRGRFDEIFSVDFPNAPEREEIFRIHLKKSLKDKRSDEDIRAMAKAMAEETEGYAGSDVASLVGTAVKRAWNNNSDLSGFSLDFLKTQRKYITPLAEVLKEKIERNKEKFGQYKLISASETAENMQRFEIDSDSSDPAKLLALASDEKCPPEFLEKIAGKGDAAVRLAVLDNPRCPFTIVLKLRDDSDQTVKEKADEKFRKSTAGIKEILASGTQEQKLRLARDIDKLPEDIRDEAMKTLAETGDGEIALALLENKYLSQVYRDSIVSRAHHDEAFKAILLEAAPSLAEQINKTYRIGETGPGGGLVFYDKGSYGEGWRYMEAAPVETEKKMVWGASGSTVKGTLTDIGAGPENTRLVAAFMKKKKETWTAAQYCEALNYGGYNDWFLPSKDELNQVYKTLKTKNLGGFSYEWYWSSSEGYRVTAWGQRFSDGSQYYNFKGYEGSVRAVRAF